MKTIMKLLIILLFGIMNSCGNSLSELPGPGQAVYTAEITHPGAVFDANTCSGISATASCEINVRTDSPLAETVVVDGVFVARIGVAYEIRATCPAVRDGLHGNATAIASGFLPENPEGFSPYYTCAFALLEGEYGLPFPDSGCWIPGTCGATGSKPATAFGSQGAILWQNPAPISTADLEPMSRAALVILDVEHASRGVAEQLRQLNPSILVGFYANPMELWQNEMPDRPWGNALRAEINTSYHSPNTGASFYVMNAPHSSVFSWWPSMNLMNLSSTSPMVGNLRYPNYIAQRIVQQVSGSQPDVILLDNCWRDAAWLGLVGKGTIDINWNGINDPAELSGDPFAHPINVSWRAGISTMIESIRQAVPEAVIVCNQPNEYFGGLAAGKYFEQIEGSIPGPSTWNWGALGSTPGDYATWVEDYLRPGGFTWNLIESGDSGLDETAVVFALLYPDHFFILRKNLATPPPVALTPIGDPLGLRRREGGLLVRDFEKAVAVMNPTASAATYVLNGASILIPAQRGRVLFKS